LITFCRDSQEAFNRVVRHYNTLNIPDAIEWVIIDHCSKPELEFETEPNFRTSLSKYENCKFHIYSSLRNYGVEQARGDYLVFFGIDTWISSEWIRFALFRTDKYAVSPRNRAMLDENGKLTVLKDQLFMDSGADWISREVFDCLGGFDVDLDEICFEDTDFRMRYLNHFATINHQGKVSMPEMSLAPRIYTWPEKGQLGRPNFLFKGKKHKQNPGLAEQIINTKDKLPYFNDFKLKVITE